MDVNLPNGESSSLVKDGIVICGPTTRGHPFGIFSGGNILDYSFSVVLLEISLIVVISRVLRFLLKPLRQPRIISEVLGGIIIGPSVLGRSKKFHDHVFPDKAAFLMKNVGLMGFMYFLFLSGVKMDLTLIKRSGRKEWTIALMGFIIPLISASFVAILHFDSLDKGLARVAPIMGISSSLAITSFPVIYPIIKELNLLNSEVGQMAMATALITDLFGLVIIISFEAAMQGQIRGMAALWYMISFIVLMFVIMFGIRQVMFWIIRTTPEGKPVQQAYIVTIFLGVLIMGFVTDFLGLAIANGPLWLGLAIPDGPPLGATLVEKGETFIMEILMPFSFAYVGLTTDFGTMTSEWSIVKPIFFIVFTGYLMKMVASLVTSYICDVPLRDSVTLALSVSLRGQVEFLLFMHWMDLKIITKSYFSILVLLTTVVTATATPFISVLYDPTRPYMISKRRNIQHNPHNTELHIVACIPDEENAAGVITLLDVSNPTISSPFSVYAVRLVELVGRATPVFIDHETEELDPNFTIQNPIHNALNNFQESRSQCVEVHPYTTLSPKGSMYQDVCELALRKKASLIILPFHKERVISITSTEAMLQQEVQSVYSNVLAHAPCSVAVLVQKCPSQNPFSTGFSGRSTHHFAVLFLGGADAREALAYADRMAGNVDVSLTVIRFLSHNGEGDDEMEKKLDDGLVTCFWVKNEGNDQVSYKEVVVRNGAETVAAIRSLNSEYFDMWIVGRKQRMNPLLIQGLASWSENDELGVIGDYISSADFDSRASVLVIQQQMLRGQETSSTCDFLGKFLCCTY